MREYLPLIIPCAIIGVFTLVFLCAYAVLKKKTAKETSERHMPDSEIIRRLLRYATPYKKEFALIFFIMLVSIAYDVVSPLLVATIQGTIKQSFQLSRLFTLVAVYAGILAVSMVCTYFQAMILQKIGQKILTQLRMDTFTHIEQLSRSEHGRRQVQAAAKNYSQQLSDHLFGSPRGLFFPLSFPRTARPFIHE